MFLSGPVGWDRLFLRQMGAQISWLIPGALIGMVAVLWITRRSPRTDRIRAGIVLFGGWLLLTGATLSFAQGIIHPYYTVALAPATAGLVGMSTATLWRHRRSLFWRSPLALALMASVVWAFVMLGWIPGWYPDLRWAVVVGGVLVAAALLLVGQRGGILVAVFVGLGIASVLSGPAAYALATAATPQTGALVTAGPVDSGTGFGGVGGQGLGSLATNGMTLPAGFPLPSGHRLPSALHIPASFFRPGGPAAAFGALSKGAGALLDGSTPGKELTALLGARASRYTWVAATTGSDSASGYQLATGDPVMAIGGFNGTDPAPTLIQFERDVFVGKIHYYIAGGGFGGVGSGDSQASQIAKFVQSHYLAQSVDGATVYDLNVSAALPGGF